MVAGDSAVGDAAVGDVAVGDAAAVDGAVDAAADDAADDATDGAADDAAGDAAAAGAAAAAGSLVTRACVVLCGSGLETRAALVDVVSPSAGEAAAPAPVIRMVFVADLVVGVDFGRFVTVAGLGAARCGSAGLFPFTVPTELSSNGSPGALMCTPTSASETRATP